MEPQYGDEPVVPFSFMTDPAGLKNRAICHLTYTTPETHRIILDNLDRAPMYSGSIHGTGARYCPSIEDKIVRFRDKDRHPIFLEPEGLHTNEWYVQGMSTSMPEDVQRMIYASVPGLENARVLRLAYAIEYDCIDPLALDSTLGARPHRRPLPRRAGSTAPPATKRPPRRASAPASMPRSSPPDGRPCA